MATRAADLRGTRAGYAQHGSGRKAEGGGLPNVERETTAGTHFGPRLVLSVEWKRPFLQRPLLASRDCGDPTC